jgi:uracil-DNA glycosylase
MLDDCQDARRHKPRRTHDATGAGQLADLDGRARAADLDAAPGSPGFDHVFPGGAVAGVDENLDEISLSHTSQLFPIRAQLKRSRYVTAEPPERPKSVEELREAAAGCHGCDLWENATQTVFGEGAEHARLMFIGEQPGDQEDLQGKPFVGPAGKLLERALDEAGIDRRRVYVTNAVKHFRWTRRGKRRLHEKPNAGQVRACRPWLEAEIEVVRPRLLVLLGATAAQSVMGSAFRVSRQRGEVLPSPFGIPVLATVHPSSILRATDDESREAAMSSFVADLKLAAKPA